MRFGVHFATAINQTNHDGPMVTFLPSWLSGYVPATGDPVLGPRCSVSLPYHRRRLRTCGTHRKSPRRSLCVHQHSITLIAASRSADLVLFGYYLKFIFVSSMKKASVHSQSAGVLEAVATAALRSRLRRYDKVETSIDCNLLGLLTGSVQRVDIRGTGWESRAGLTARLLEVSLGESQLDVEAIVTRQRILLKSIPRGMAKVMFTSRDFGNFLAHPFMKQAAATAIQGQTFAFDPCSVQLNSFYGASGAISFAGRWQGNGKKYALTMCPEGNLAQVTALTESVDAALNVQKLNMSAVSADLSDSDEACRLVSEQLSQFFSTLTISLQGIELTYDSMQLRSQTSGADGDLLELHLKVAVFHFPPPNLEF